LEEAAAEVLQDIPTKAAAAVMPAERTVVIQPELQDFQDVPVAVVPVVEGEDVKQDQLAEVPAAEPEYMVKVPLDLADPITEAVAMEDQEEHQVVQDQDTVEETEVLMVVEQEELQVMVPVATEVFKVWELFVLCGQETPEHSHQHQLDHHNK
jgi:hypothetical protein